MNQKNAALPFLYDTESFGRSGDAGEDISEKEWLELDMDLVGT